MARAASSAPTAYIPTQTTRTVADIAGQETTEGGVVSTLLLISTSTVPVVPCACIAGREIMAKAAISTQAACTSFLGHDLILRRQFAELNMNQA